MHHWSTFKNMVLTNDNKDWLITTFVGYFLVWCYWAQVNLIVLLSLQKLHSRGSILWRSSEGIGCLLPLPKSTYIIVNNLLIGVASLRGGQNVEFQNVNWPKISEHRKCLLSWSEHRKSKRSECRKWHTYGLWPS